MILVLYSLSNMNLKLFTEKIFLCSVVRGLVSERIERRRPVISKHILRQTKSFTVKYRRKLQQNRHGKLVSVHHC